MTTASQKFALDLLDQAVTGGCVTALAAIGGATASVIAWDWQNIGGAFAAGAVVTTLAAFAKRNIGQRNTVTVTAPATVPALPAVDPVDPNPPRHLA